MTPTTSYRTCMLTALMASVLAMLMSCSDALLVDADSIITDKVYTLSEGSQWQALHSIPSEGQTYQLQVTANDNTSWGITGTPSWLTVTPSSGTGTQTVTVTAAANTAVGQGRTAPFMLASTVSEWPYKIQMLAKQGESSRSLTVTPSPGADDYSFTATGGKVTIAVNANVAWRAQCTAGFFSLSTTEGKTGASTTELTVQQYNTLDIASRTGSIIFSDAATGTAMLTVDVSQLPLSTTVSTQRHDIAMGNKMQSQTISTGLGTVDGEYTVVCSDSWLDAKALTTTGSIGVTVTANDNTSTASSDRIGHVYIYIKGHATALHDIVVTQAANTLSVSPTDMDIAADGGRRDITVTANGPWNVTLHPEWVQWSKNSDNVCQLTIAANSTTEPRSGTVTFTRSDISMSATLQVRQAAGQPNNNAESLTLQFGPTAGSQTYIFSAEASTAWSVTTSDTWLHLSPTSGTGSGSITLSVDANNTMSRRLASAILHIGDRDVNISIEQASAYINSLSDAVTLPPTAGSGNTITLHTDGAWTAASSQSWLTLSKTSGTGNAEVTATATGNASLQPRTATITFTSQSGAEIMVVVTQSGLTLTVSQSSVTFFQQGGESNAITVTTDGTFEATPSDSWITVAKTGNVIRITTTANNDPQQRSGTVTVSLAGLSQGESLSRIIDVVQAGKATDAVVAQNATFDHEARGGNSIYQFVADASHAWTISSDAAWLHLSQTSGTGGAMLSVSTDENDTPAQRTAHATLTVNGVTATITVRQSAYTISLSTSTVVFEAHPATGKSVAITSDGPWTVSSSQSWLTVSRTSGSGDNTITLTAADNESAQVRHATVTVTSRSGEKLTVVVTQNPTSNATTIDQNGYNGGENNWNQQPTNNGSFNQNGYGDEKDWNQQPTNNGSFNQNGYGDDNDINQHPTNNGDFNQNGYGEDYDINQRTINGHEYVDLGLPSGTLWATCNVGASSPKEAGEYYAWGETETKSSYTQDNCLTYYEDISVLRSLGIIDANDNLTQSHDVAAQQWGGGWHMPTRKQIEELSNRAYCNWTWAIDGYYITSTKNGNSIFLPMTGIYGESVSIRDYSWYGGATAYGKCLFYAIEFTPKAGGCDTSNIQYGHCVRPVSDTK